MCGEEDAGDGRYKFRLLSRLFRRRAYLRTIHSVRTRPTQLAQSEPAVTVSQIIFNRALTGGAGTAREKVERGTQLAGIDAMHAASDRLRVD